MRITYRQHTQCCREWVLILYFSPFHPNLARGQVGAIHRGECVTIKINSHLKLGQLDLLDCGGRADLGSVRADQPIDEPSSHHDRLPPVVALGHHLHNHPRDAHVP